MHNICEESSLRGKLDKNIHVTTGSDYKACLLPSNLFFAEELQTIPDILATIFIHLFLFVLRQCAKAIHVIGKKEYISEPSKEQYGYMF